MRVRESQEYLEDVKGLDKHIQTQLDKSILDLIEHCRPLGFQFKHAHGVWERHIGKHFRLYYKMDSECLDLLRFLNKKYQKKLRF